MVALARKTLIYEWRRFLPAVLAVGFAGLLQLLQIGLVLGIFGSASIYISGSTADLWIGYPGTQSVNLGRSIDRGVEMRVRMDPAVTHVEPFIWLDTNWLGPPGTGNVSVFVSGIDTSDRGMMFAKVLPRELRRRLEQPDAVVIDHADLDNLGAAVGGSALINGHRVHVVGVGQGLRALGGVNVLSSLETARRLDPSASESGQVTYLVAALRDPSQANTVAARLRGARSFGLYDVWAAREFARRSQLYWIFDTGAGAGVLFLAGVVFLVGVVITSQTLAGTVLGSIREYATLNALGVGVGALRRVVLEQACWVGSVGLLGSAVLGFLALLLAHAYSVPLALGPFTTLLCLILEMALALLSGLVAMRGLRHADPASLLR